MPGVYRRRYYGPRRHIERGRWLAGSFSKFYVHDAATTVTGTLPGAGSQSATTPAETASGASTNRSMDGNAGASEVSVTTTVLALDATIWHRRFVSPTLATQDVKVGNWTIFGAASESIGTVNAQFIGGVLYQWRPSTGSRIAYVFDSPTIGATAPGTSETAVSTAISGSAVSLVDGDVLILEVWNDFSTAGAGTVTYYYDGTTEASTSSNAGYILTPQRIVLSTAVVTEIPDLVLQPILAA